jgi:E3 ubiquitin-protein ligase BRE1
MQVSPSASIQPVESRDTLDLEILQEQVKRREAKIIELEREAALLKDQKTILELDVSH